MTTSDTGPAVTGIVLVQINDARVVWLRSLLQSSRLELLDEVTSTTEAVASASRHRPGVVIMDIALDWVEGRGLLTAIRDVSPATLMVLRAWAADLDDAPGMRHWLNRMCDAVLSPPWMSRLEARLALSGRPQSVPVARRFITELLTQWTLREHVERAGLLTSELVANAVLHVRGPCALELTCQADALRVAVADAGSQLPDLQHLNAASEGGRGLHLVSAYSSRWGVDPLVEGGKVVWAEVDSMRRGTS